jgi:hypothetical protein
MLLDCGAFGNKICAVGEYFKMKSWVKKEESILKKMKKKFGTHCFIFPRVDPANFPAVYLCAENVHSVHNLYKFVGKVSRLIDIDYLKTMKNKVEFIRNTEKVKYQQTSV